MKNLIVTFGLFVSLLITACGGTMKQYEKSNVEILSVEEPLDGKTEIVYRPILDSMYYCPGAHIRHEGERQKVSFIRCQISEKCPADVIAEKLAQNQWKLVVSSEADKIDLVFSDGEIQLLQKSK
jgi:hypothetical protein